MSFPWGAVAQAAGSLIGGTIGAISTHNENKFWANYNSPKEQMKRLSDAHLNPNLVYQNGNALTEAKPVGDVGAQLQQGISQAGNVLNKALENRLTKAQVTNVQSNTDKNNAETEKALAEARKARAEAQMMEGEDYQGQYSFVNGLRGRQASYYASEEEVAKADSAFKQVQKERAELEKQVYAKYGEKNAEQDYLYSRYKAQIEKTESEWREDLLQLQYDLGHSGIQLNAVQMGKLANDIAVGNALIQEYNARVEFLTAQTTNEKERYSIIQNDYELGVLKNEYQGIVNNWAHHGVNFEHYSTTDHVGPWSSTTTGDVRSTHKSPFDDPTPRSSGKPKAGTLYGGKGVGTHW